MRARVIKMAVVFLMLAALTSGCGDEEGVPVTLVLIDRSGSTASARVRARYAEALDMVAGGVAAEEGLLVLDGFAARPSVSSRPRLVSLQMDERIRGNPLYEQRWRAQQLKRVRRVATPLLQASDGEVGTDHFAAVRLAAGILAKYPGRVRRLVLLSDMVVAREDLDLGASDGEVKGRALLESGDVLAPLRGVAVYVTGAGDDVGGGLSPVRVTFIEDFWRQAFDRADAEVVAYGGGLLTFP